MSTFSKLKYESNELMLLNKNMTCYINNNFYTYKNSKGSETKLNNQLEHKILSYSLNVLNKHFKNKDCLSFEKHFWQYEYCHNRYIRQWLEVKGVIYGEYYLGYYDNEESNEKILKKDEMVIDDSENGRFLKKRFFDGTYCPDIGKNRSAQVVFKCCTHDHIADVREFSVCSYVIEIHSPAMCSKLKESKDVEINEIECILNEVVVEHAENKKNEVLSGALNSDEVFSVVDFSKYCIKDNSFDHYCVKKQNEIVNGNHELSAFSKSKDKKLPIFNELTVEEDELVVYDKLLTVLGKKKLALQKKINDLSGKDAMDSVKDYDIFNKASYSTKKKNIKQSIQNYVSDMKFDSSKQNKELGDFFFNEDVLIEIETNLKNGKLAFENNYSMNLIENQIFKVADPNSLKLIELFKKILKRDKIKTKFSEEEYRIIKLELKNLKYLIKNESKKLKFNEEYLLKTKQQLLSKKKEDALIFEIYSFVGRNLEFNELNLKKLMSLFKLLKESSNE